MHPSKLLEAAGFKKVAEDFFLFHQDLLKLLDKVINPRSIKYRFEGVEEPQVVEVKVLPQRKVVVIDRFRPLITDMDMWEYLEDFMTDILKDGNVLTLWKCGRGFCGELETLKGTWTVDTPQPTIGGVLWRLVSEEAEYMAGGAAPRRKGVRAERELVKKLKDMGIEAKRVPLSGSAEGFKGDVILEDSVKAEVKVRRRGLANLYRWLTQPILFVKEDYKDWLVVMDLSTFVKLWQKGGKALGALGSTGQKGEAEEE